MRVCEREREKEKKMKKVLLHARRHPLHTVVNVICLWLSKELGTHDDLGWPIVFGGPAQLGPHSVHKVVPMVPRVEAEIGKEKDKKTTGDGR